MLRRSCAAALLLALAMFTQARAAQPPSADPAWYHRQGTWFETMLAARDSLAAVDAKATHINFVSEVICGGEAARHIAVAMAGQKDLYLYVVGAPEVVYAAATWADAKLIDKNGKETRLTQIKGLKVLEGQHSIDVNLYSGVSGPLSIAGQKFEHGLHVYPNFVSKVHVPLDGEYERFEASVGIDDWVGKHGAVRFIVADAEGAARQDVWSLLARDFAEETPRREMKWEREDQILEDPWTVGDFAGLAKRYAAASSRVPELAGQARQLASSVRDAAGLTQVRVIYHRSRALDLVFNRAKSFDFRPLRMAIDDLCRTFGRRYSKGQKYADRLASLEKAFPAALAKLDAGRRADLEAVEKLLAEHDQLQRQALFDNPLLDFDRLILVKRKPDGDPRMAIGTGFGLGEFIGLPRQTSKNDPDIDRYYGWENEIDVLSPVRPDGKLTTLYKPDEPKLILDLDLHFDADKLAFSMPGTSKHWHVFEAKTAHGGAVGVADALNVRQLTPTDQPDVHYYDPCYLPNGKVAFLSTACFQGVPCNAGVIVGMMYLMNGDGSGIRQICFEQDHDYYPVVMNDGRIMYSRWDYTDTPHVWNRMLFTCNPDGTGQMEYYKANGYWPNAIFYAKPIPNHPTKVVGIVTGHHVGRVGELTIFDPSQGRTEADGVVQQIPGYGKKVTPKIQDKLTEHSWPKFLHPYPLSEKYFLVACKPTPDSLWGIYLVDTFDNMVLVKEVEGNVLLEPIPLRKRVKPPVIPDRYNPQAKDALVYLQDVYTGPSMKDIPRGTVKKLRVVSYHFAYQRIAGIDHRVGADGPWEVKRVLGTVDVESDGSALFRAPAKTPFTVQPLDAEGKAVQLMRSWMTAMLGETLSCVGCHDNRGSAPPQLKTLALSRAAQAIKPWHGPNRGFSFMQEVQPVLDRHCVACHDGQAHDGRTPVDLRREQGYLVCYKGGDPKGEIIRDTPRENLLGKYGGIFDPSYIALRRYVRVGGLESDLHILPPMEFSSSTAELIQMLRKGHHNVQLDDDAWDRLQTWIDLNAPCHGTWAEFLKIGAKQCQRRNELAKLYGGLEDETETAIETPPAPVTPIMPPPMVKAQKEPLKLAGWPLAAAEAQRLQSAGGPSSRTIDLGDGIKLDLVRIPVGSFVMGDVNGFVDEQPQAIVKIGKAFWMGKFEITNEQFNRFDPTHDSRFEHRTSWIFSEEYLGWPLNQPKQPVVRISWKEAMAFCQWLSQQSGLRFTLPTEAQWEYACRAGTDTPLSYGTLDSDFSTFANVADYNIRDLAYQGWRPKAPDLAPRDPRFDDHALVTASVGSYHPNNWGLFDMHGNAAEWTRTVYKSYPWREDDRRNALDGTGQRVARGGSWYDRPLRCRSSFRLAYQPYQKVFNVGFRVVCEADAAVAVRDTLRPNDE